MRRLRQAACREPPMRRIPRRAGAICCPARRALRAVLQPHPVLRRADRRRVEPTAPRLRRLGPPAGSGGCSVRGKRRRCLRVPHRCPCAFPRGRSTGLGVAGFAIRSRRGASGKGRASQGMVPRGRGSAHGHGFAPGATRADVKKWGDVAAQKADTRLHGKKWLDDRTAAESYSVGGPRLLSRGLRAAGSARVRSHAYTL